MRSAEKETPGPGTVSVMQEMQYRYFIELQQGYGENVTRRRETEIRRKMAADFIDMLREWLDEMALTDKVSTMSVTTFGQVQITCEPSIIGLIRNQDVMSIANIRQGLHYADTIKRLSDDVCQAREF